MHVLLLAFILAVHTLPADLDTRYPADLPRSNYPVQLMDLGPALRNKLADYTHRRYPEYSPDVPSACGDGKCTLPAGEHCLSCPQDCGQCVGARGVTRGCVDPSHVALTFDDGPSEYTSLILDALAGQDAYVTFFMIGQKMRFPQLAEIARRVIKEGHLLASHTWDHRSISRVNSSSPALDTIPQLSIEAIRRELLYADAAFAAQTGHRPIYFRFPYLELNETSMAVVQAMNYTVVDINTDTKDFEVYQFPDGASKIFNAIIVPFQYRLNQLANEKSLTLNTSTSNQTSLEGIISLQHDIFARSAHIVKDVVKQIKFNGGKMVTIDECIGRKDEKYHPPDPAFTMDSDAVVAEEISSGFTTTIHFNILIFLLSFVMMTIM